MAATGSSLGESLRQSFLKAGCRFADIDLLQPADPFLDTAGEDLRRRIFITAGAGGQTLCLRPEFTIPVCLHYLTLGKGPARYAYLGEVFRQRADEPEEFLQAGVEDLADSDSIAADIRCINDALTALDNAGQTDLDLVLGDQTIFAALLSAIDVPVAWQAKLLRGFGDSEHLAGNIRKLAAGENGDTRAIPEAFKQAIDSGDRAEAVGWMQDQMRAANLPLSGGRTAEAIVERMIAKLELGSARLSGGQRKALEEFLAIESPLAEAPELLGGFADRHGIDLGESLERFAERAKGLAPHLGELSASRYRSAFGRRLDYYTGIAFEIYRPGLDKPLIGGGRYDRLLSLLGAKTDIPAIGFSVWLERLAVPGGAS